MGVAVRYIVILRFIHIRLIPVGGWSVMKLNLQANSNLIVGHDYEQLPQRV
jgi:hypothetical protein